MSIFCDKTQVEFIAGTGGNGALHFHREKFVSRGGPDGGDGGVGGSIILLADGNMNTLSEYNTKKIYRAEEGSNGAKNNMSGKAGENLILKVPAGTLIVDAENKQLLCDLKTHGQQFVVAKGGRGGMGNAQFKSSVHKVPMFAENGEEGQRRKIIMELQLVADVGIIGFPSSGKSTLISVISNAKPKIADYPFTTLIPNLGVLDMNRFDKKTKDSFVIADIPGLIEGAHIGKGLGHEFLRHVSRTEVLVHLIDPTRNQVEDYQIINKELAAYSNFLARKKQIVAISKIDALDDESLQEFKKNLEKKNPKLKNKIHLISSITGTGLKELVFEMYKEVQKIRKTRGKKLEKENFILTEGSSSKIFEPHLEKNRFEVIYRRTKMEAASQKSRKVFDVYGARIEQVVAMTDLENTEGLERIHHFLNKMGIRNELKKQGAKPGDRIRIAGKTIIMRGPAVKRKR